MAPTRIERVTVAGWPRVRDVRLRALADAPDAFGSMLEEMRSHPDAFWMERLQRATRATFVATRGNQDVGLAVGDQYEEVGYEGAAGLFGMWVAPEARGQGVGEALIEAVLAWARERGYERVLLDVGDANEPARRLYARMGFVPNGETSALPSPRAHICEHQLERRL